MQRLDDVAEKRRHGRELRAGELHAVAGVARKADDHLGELLDGLTHCLVTGIADRSGGKEKRVLRRVPHEDSRLPGLRFLPGVGDAGGNTVSLGLIRNDDRRVA